MRRLARILLAVLYVAAPAAAQETSPPVVVRTAVAPAKGAMIGQHVAYYVDVMFRGEMPRPPRVARPGTPGIQTFRFETQGATLSDEIAGVAYVGQRFEFALYARRGGDFVIPSPVVVLLDRKGDVTGKAKGDPVNLEVIAPPGVDPSAPLVATRSFNLDEQWSPAPDGVFKAGDAIVRTIVQTAEDVPGFVLGGPPQGAPAGVRVYVAAPDVQDRMDRGAITGRRVDRVTYVFERSGRFELPAATQAWWDIGSGALKHATGPAATVEVEAGPAPIADGGARLWTGFAWTGLGLAGLIGLVLLARPMLRRRQARRADPESKAFAVLRRACAGAEVGAVYRSFTDWVNHLPPQKRQAANRKATALRSALFAAGPAAWTASDSRRLLGDLDALRRCGHAHAPPPALPPLNPAGPAPVAR
ncbi:MAG: hypothetical protein ACK5JM_07925 [Rhodoblastus sp.]